MDNTMMMHGERAEAINEVLRDGESFGRPYQVTSTFTTNRAFGEEWMAKNIRVQHELEPQGCLGDLAWYCIRISLLAFGFEDPDAVSCHYLQATPEGVPVTVAGTMRWSGGRWATFDASYRSSWRNWAQISSEKCCLNVEGLVIP